MPLTHAFVSGKADGGDPTQVQPSHWNAAHVVDANGLPFPDSTAADPAAPSTGSVLYGRTMFGRPVLKLEDPTGFEQVLQRAAAFCRVSELLPGNGFLTALGTANSFFGAGSAPTPSSASHLGSVRRFQGSSSTVAGSVVGVLVAGAAFVDLWRGNAAGRGGFLAVTRFGLWTMVASQRGFFGLWDSSSAPTNVDPTTDTSRARLGIGFNTNTGNWQWINNAESVSTPTVTDTGIALDTTSVIELSIGCLPNDSKIYYRVRNVTTGAVFSGSVSTNIPASTTFLSYIYTMTNNTTAAQASWALIKARIEADV